MWVKSVWQASEIDIEWSLPKWNRLWECSLLDGLGNLQCKRLWACLMDQWNRLNVKPVCQASETGNKREACLMGRSVSVDVKHHVYLLTWAGETGLKSKACLLAQCNRLWEWRLSMRIHHHRVFQGSETGLKQAIICCTSDWPMKQIMCVWWTNERGYENEACMVGHWNRLGE